MTDLFTDVKEKSPEDLIPYSNNPKNHPEEQVNKIASSIKNNGFIQPIVTDSENEIIIGHGRLQAAKKLGLNKVPVIQHDELTDAEAKALRLADNKIAESSMEDEKLAVELEQLKEEDDFEDLIHGFDEDEMSEYLDSLTDEQDLEELETESVDEVETDIEEGDIFELGQHRLMCGDATDEEHADKLMNGKKADMVLTDPPYGINVVENSGVLQGQAKGEYVKNYNPVKNDDGINLTFLLEKFIEDTKMIVWGGNFFAHYFPPSTHWIVWDKRGSNMDGASSTGDQSDVELAWTNIERTSVKKYQHVWAGWFREGNQEEEGETKKHPTQKPVGLHKDILDDYTEQEQNVVDLFAGSGSILLACEQTDRKAFCMELEPQYCQVIINRWEDLTGKEAEKLP